MVDPYVYKKGNWYNSAISFLVAPGSCQEIHSLLTFTGEFLVNFQEMNVQTKHLLYVWSTM